MVFKISRKTCSMVSFHRTWSFVCLIGGFEGPASRYNRGFSIVSMASSYCERTGIGLGWEEGRGVDEGSIDVGIVRISKSRVGDSGYEIGIVWRFSRVASASSLSSIDVSTAASGCGCSGGWVFVPLRDRFFGRCSASSMASSSRTFSDASYRVDSVALEVFFLYWLLVIIAVFLVVFTVKFVGTEAKCIRIYWSVGGR